MKENTKLEKTSLSAFKLHIRDAKEQHSLYEKKIKLIFQKSGLQSHSFVI